MLKEHEIPAAKTECGSGAAPQRRLLFLSHATPQDNEFARWLASQLAIAGYEVWCDVTELLGGERFWKDIEEAIDSVTFRFFFVSTLHANTKPGTLRELNLAQRAQEAHGLKDFIVPLKIDQFPFASMQANIQDLNMVRFDETWAAGLQQLLALLEREGAPKSELANANAVMDWYSRSLEPGYRSIVSNDKYLSNWFRLKLPKHLYAHRFRGPVSNLPSVAAGFSHPYRILGSRLLTFAPGHEIVDALGDGWAEDDLIVLKTSDFLMGGSKDLEVASFDASNVVSDLIRQAWEMEMRSQGLHGFELASGLQAWFFKHQHLDKNKAYFTALGGRRTYRQLVGLKSKRDADGNKVRDGYWHYALSASPQLHPFARLVLRHHVIFTDDGETPWEKPDRMHKARRSVCKQWWNREWRDRLLAFCAQLSGGSTELALTTGGEELSVAMVPMRFTSPWTYFEDGETGLDETAEIELVEDMEEDEGEEDDESD